MILLIMAISCFVVAFLGEEPLMAGVGLVLLIMLALSSM